jgi:ABC-type dipeptide/oligopeptide/nickel transport system permease component
MLAVILRRLLQGVLVVLGVTIVIFTVIRLIPGDPTRLMAPNASEEKLDSLREQFGFKDPIPVQFVKFLSNAGHGDFGFSFFEKDKVTTLIARAAPKTLLLAAAALVFAMLFSFPLGILAALKRGSVFDQATLAIAVTAQSMPNFWVAIMLLYIVAVQWHLMPAIGFQDVTYAILPAIALSLSMVAMMIRTVRLVMIDNLNMDFVKAARARGIPAWRVIITHALRNAVIPLITMLGVQIGYLLGGAVVIEMIFNYPGLGLLTLNAVLRRDYYLVQGLVIVFASIFVIINMAVDISYAYLDPRIRKALGGL